MTDARRPDGHVLGEAMSRSLLLLRDHLRGETTDDVILHALTETKIVLCSDGANLASPGAREAILALTMLALRSGATVFLDAPNVEVEAIAPWTRTRLLDAALDDSAEMLPGRRPVSGRPPAEPDLAVLVGDTPWLGSARNVIRVGADGWEAAVTSTGPGARWTTGRNPFGPLAAAALAAAEVVKATVARLEPWAISPIHFRARYERVGQAEICVAPAGTPLPGTLGAFDLVSGGAITHAALYALARLPEVSGQARVIEPDTYELSNLNRYALLVTRDVGTRKAEHLAIAALGALSLTPIRCRYAADSGFSLQSTVLVGVDHIPTRWDVQDTRPEWLGIGATSHDSVMVSEHRKGLACARCLHPRDEVTNGPLPSAAFVSFWAGLLLAARFVRWAAEVPSLPTEQWSYLTPLRLDGGVWTAAGHPLEGCPLACPL